MWQVFLLFMIPVGGGIPAGVLLARAKGIGWASTSFLYFVSDCVLALLFEPVMLAVVAAGKRIPALAHAAAMMKESARRTAAQYGGPGAGPFALILIAFAVDPMTGRSAAHAAGHGFVSGWAIAIAGDMLYFWVVAVTTVKLSKTLGNPEAAVGVMLLAMMFLPALLKRLRRLFVRAA